MTNNLHYRIITVAALLESYDGNEAAVEKILRQFRCGANADVEKFLLEKALVFDRQGISKTHLVYTSYQGKYVLGGYYALANKSFVVKNNAKISRALKRRVARFGLHDDELRQYVITAPLSGQRGKFDPYRHLITGDVLLYYACGEVKKVQDIVGGKFVYLECEDKPRLIEFYKENGFVEFGSRELEADEKDSLSGTYLVQMMKYLNE